MLLYVRMGDSETECSVSVSQQKSRKCHGILDNHSLRDHY